MNLAQSTVLSAIKYSQGKYGYANIILAGPTCAGKRELAEAISKRLDYINFERTVSIISQEDYGRDEALLETNKFGVKNIDSLEAFDVDKYLFAARAFAMKEEEYKVGYGVAKFPLPGGINLYDGTPKRRVNIYTGPHVIELLQSSEIEIPNAITIFLNADMQNCIERRMKSGVMLPTITLREKELKEYFDFVKCQIKTHVFPQKEMADIVINCD